MNEKQMKFYLYLFIILGIVIFSYGIHMDNVWLVFIGIFNSVFGFIGVTFSRAYYMFTKEEDIHETLKKYKTLHIAICSECGKENILEDIYCVKCGNKLGEEDEDI